MRAERAQRGVALLLALLVTALLTMTVLEFTYSSQVEYRRTVHWAKTRQAALLAEAGVELAREILTHAPLLYLAEFLREKEADSLNELWARLCAEDAPDRCPATREETCAWNAGDLGEQESFAIRIEDATGRFNLNYFAGGPPLGNVPTAPVQVLSRLLVGAGLNEAVVGAIVDWADADNQPFPFAPGAESSWYLSEGKPYTARNGALATFRELALVNGIGARELATLSRIVTVLPPTVPNAVKININTASVEVLRALDPGLEPIVWSIHEARCQSPFTSAVDVQSRVTGWPEELGAAWFEAWIRFKSDVFSVRATGRVDEVYSSIEAYLRQGAGGFEVLRSLAQAGPNIVGIDMSAVTSLNDVSQGFEAPRGRL
jgi:general secretion pathway protein K